MSLNALQTKELIKYMYYYNQALKETLNMLKNDDENNILVMKTIVFVTLLYICCELILSYNKRKLRYPFINNPWRIY